MAMQAMSFGSPAVTERGMAVPELDKPEVVTETPMINDPGASTPMRVTCGQRLCPTPKSVKVRVSKSEECSGVHPPHQPDAGKSADVENQPSFTTYSNPAFEPLEAIESPPKLQKQPPCIPVDSNGQRLCPTPKSTRSSTSPGPSKLRFPKATSFQPLATIQSSPVLKDQTKRVLGDSNGQWMQETPRVTKPCTTPRAALTTSCSENMTPRALFHQTEATGGSYAKKRTRGEDSVTRTTRSKTEAEKIITFLRSPAARVRPDGTREEYHLGVSDVLVKQYMERKMALEKSCQCDSRKSCLGCGTGDSYRLKVVPGSKVQGSPSIRLRVQSPGLLQSPLVTTPASRSGKPTPQGSAKKNLSVLLEAHK